MTVSAVLIGEILVSILQVIQFRARAAGLADEEVNKLLDDAMARVKASDANDLPDV